MGFLNIRTLPVSNEKQPTCPFMFSKKKKMQFMRSVLYLRIQRTGRITKTHTLSMSYIKISRFNFKN